MFNTEENKTISLRLLFLLGSLLGVVIFVGIYGIKILDFTNNGWLFYGDNDLRQHYIAWCNYRKDPWHFPLGLIDSLSYPNSVSVIYTDSIPLFALFFKLFRAFLPETFQYFGLYGLVTYMLMGGLASVLLARFCDDSVICLVGSCFYIASFQVLQRLYYHSALAAQWLIILAMVLWVYDEVIKSDRKRLLAWCALGFLCVSIHSYYLPMVGLILFALACQKIVRKISSGVDVCHALILPLAMLLIFCVSALLTLWIFGAFYGGTGASGWGLGTFGANLNTFINPIDYGRILPRLPLYYDFQYEGFGYLGCGILFLYIIVAIGLVFRSIRKVPEKAFHSHKIYGIMSLFVLLVSILMSTLPLLSYGDKELISISYPELIEKILGIFRSNGRFIWVADYLLITAAISFVAYTFRRYRYVALAVLAMSLLIQGYDASKLMNKWNDYCSKDYEITTVWDLPEYKALTEGKDEFIFLYNNNDITLYTAYYGYLHGMRQNNYYYARNIDEQINKEIGKYIEEIKRGEIRENAVYIINDEMYFENQELYDGLGQIMRFAYMDGHFVFSK